ncbi:unnamed protein product, partial [Rotaria socialis]
YDDNNNLRIYKDDVLENNGQLMIWLEGLLEWKGTVPEYVGKHPYVDTPLEEIKKKERDSWGSSWD